MSSTEVPGEAAPVPEQEQSSPAKQRSSIVELVLDNLPMWTVVAAAITLLYLVWATIDVLNGYVGDLPSMVP